MADVGGVGSLKGIAAFGGAGKSVPAKPATDQQVCADGFESSVPGPDLRLHLKSKRSEGVSETERAVQAGQVSALVSEERPVVVAGDLNPGPSSLTEFLQAQNDKLASEPQTMMLTGHPSGWNPHQGNVPGFEEYLGGLSRGHSSLTGSSVPTVLTMSNTEVLEGLKDDAKFSVQSEDGPGSAWNLFK